MTIDDDTLRDALADLCWPDGVALGASPACLGFSITSARVSVTLNIGARAPDSCAALRVHIVERIKALGVSSVQVVLTAARTPAAPARTVLPHVKKIIAVASGKGGVGKSTTAVNLALALHQRGYRVGLLDADIYGPSLPALLGLRHAPAQDDNGKIVPHHVHGLQALSIGFMVADGAALIWRGPMVDRALMQFVNGAAWPALDVLVIDTPPGTGDAHLTMLKKIPLDGAVIVSTAHDLALVDARKAQRMFAQAGVPVLGLVENMSALVCPVCGKIHPVFSHGGVEEEAQASGVGFLGAVPLHLALRDSADAGTPFMAQDPAPTHPVAKAYRTLAVLVDEALFQAPERPSICP